MGMKGAGGRGHLRALQQELAEPVTGSYRTQFPTTGLSLVQQPWAGLMERQTLAVRITGRLFGASHWFCGLVVIR